MGAACPTKGAALLPLAAVLCVWHWQLVRGQ